MKLLTILIILLFGIPSFSKVITGEVSKQTRKDVNQIYDSATNVPIEGVIIKIPSKNYVTKTDKNGSFKLKTEIDSPTIMSLAKNGYKPYSMTLNETGRHPLQIGIEKTTPQDIILDTDMIHIGDNSYSPNSANAFEFSSSSNGAFYSKDFKIKPLKQSETLFLTIGSIIGIDTIFAQRLGQSKVLTAYSSPPELFFNGNKISEIKINGDNQKIKLPQGLIKSNQLNNITIRTGRNLFKTASVDYDDIEFTNLLLEIK